MHLKWSLWGMGETQTNSQISIFDFTPLSDFVGLFNFPSLFNFKGLFDFTQSRASWSYLLFVKDHYTFLMYFWFQSPFHFLGLFDYATHFTTLLISQCFPISQTFSISHCFSRSKVFSISKGFSILFDSFWFHLFDFTPWSSHCILDFKGLFDSYPQARAHCISDFTVLSSSTLYLLYFRFHKPFQFPNLYDYTALFNYTTFFYFITLSISNAFLIS